MGDRVTRGVILQSLLLEHHPEATQLAVAECGTKINTTLGSAALGRIGPPAPTDSAKAHFGFFLGTSLQRRQPIPIGAPLPDVTVKVIQPVAVRPKRAYGGREGEAISLPDCPRCKRIVFQKWGVCKVGHFPKKTGIV